MASNLMGDGVRGIIGICRARFTILNTHCAAPGFGTFATGASGATQTTANATNVEFVTDAFLNLTLARQYRTIAEAEKTSCAGKTVLWHRAESKVLKQIDLTGTIGVFDPEFQSFVLGYTALTGNTAVSNATYASAVDGKIIGVAEDITSNLPPKVAIEIFQETLGPGLTGLCSTTSADLYMRHVFPLTQLYAADSQELGADGGVEFGITGTALANPNFYKGSHPQTWLPNEYLNAAPYGWFFDQAQSVPAAATGVQNIPSGS